MTFANEDTITDMAQDRWSSTHDPRLRQIMNSLVKHLHSFVRDVELTEEEWFLGTEFLSRVGQISDDKRKEFILLSDVLGMSMLVVMMNRRTAPEATPNTVLGPFHIEDSPEIQQGETMSENIPGIPVYLSGTVRDMSGAPIRKALLDIWQADEEGVYETQIPDSDARLRALQYTDNQGRYGFWTIAPKGYSIPMDGPVGALVKKTDISHFRPAHIHFLLSAPGYRPVVTHLFREGAQYIESDVVYGVRRELIVPFVEHGAGKAPDGRQMGEAYLTVDYDFVLMPEAAATRKTVAAE